MACNWFTLKAATRKEPLMPAKPQIIADPQTNRGTAFTRDERKRFGLMGRLPAAVETLEQQAARAYKQVCRLDDDLDKYIYLEQLHDRNETLYYKVIIDHWGCAQVVDGLFMRLLSRPLGVVRIRWGICRRGWCGCGGGCRSLRSRWRPRCRPGRGW